MVTHLNELPMFVPVVFTCTVVLFGVIGFRVAYQYIRAGRPLEAHALWAQAYAVMFGILGFGYRRFFYAGYGTLPSPLTLRTAFIPRRSCGRGARCALRLLPPHRDQHGRRVGRRQGVPDVSSSIFYTLVAMGVVLLPALFYGPYHWYVAVAAGVGPRCPPSSAHRTPSGGRPSRVTKHARSARSAGHRTA